MLDITIPPKTTSKVIIPRMQHNSFSLYEGNGLIFSNNKKAKTVTNIKLVDTNKQFITLEVSAGQYAFVLKE